MVESMADVQRIALKVEYCGREYFGWQRQPSVPTVQATLEDSLAQVAGMPVTIHAAGRTDAGVHASGQIVHFDVQVRRPLTAWVRGVNSHLPSSVAVLWAGVMPDTFHARHSALTRTYRYTLLNRPVRPAISAPRLGWYYLPLDTDCMQQAADYLIGRHDFSAFRAAECQAISPVREMVRVVVSRQDDIIRFELTANAFLHHMVRNIVGSLIMVGAGARPAEWMGDLLASRNRHLAGATAAAAGLCLIRVEYPPLFGLPESAHAEEQRSKNSS